MPDDLKTEEKVDEKEVSWQNRMKEMERKFEDKYGKELEATKRELQEVKSHFTVGSAPEPNAARVKIDADLMEFVKNPREFVRDAFGEAEFRRQIPEAENWIQGQKGYTKDDDSKIFQIIKENHLDTPYHTPMDRAKTAWKLLSAERFEKKISSQTDDERREAAANINSTEGAGKSTTKEKTVTRQDLIRKLADAEAKGDLDKAIQITSLLEDVR